MFYVTEEKQYICPGEIHPISHSVHLARLAAFYPRCRDCPFRTETGQISGNTIERLQSTEQRVERKTLFTANGVRGVYLNELTSHQAGKYAVAFAHLLWQEIPLVGRAEKPKRNSQRPRPTVVVGFDERPSSPDIAAGVTAALRRTGCRVIDIALTTRACLWFAVDHLQAAGGIFITGAGAAPSWTGLEFVARHAMPLSSPGGLHAVERQLEKTNGRPTRQGGAQRSFQAFVPYVASLWKHFHALRPLKVACACPNPLVARILHEIFETLPCQLIPLEIPVRVRNLSDSQDPDVKHVGEFVATSESDVGILIDDDGARCAVFDEQGTLLAPSQITCLIAELLRDEQPDVVVVYECEVDQNDAVRSTLEAVGVQCIASGKTFEEISRNMRNKQAVFAAGDSDRYWFQETFPACDAILTLSKIVSVLSRADTPFSQLKPVEMQPIP